MGRKSYFSESDVMPLVKRYTSSTLLTLLREIAKCETAKLDWDALVKSSATGISSAREYQALWRSLAYRVELKQCFEEDECPLDDESDLEFELEPVPAVSVEVAGDVSMCVKADMQRHGISGISCKRKADPMWKSDVKEVEVAPTVVHQGSTLSGSSSRAGTVASNTSLKGIPTANNGALHFASNKQFAVVPSASNDSALLSGALCQTDRKKRRLWTPEEDLELIAAVEKCGEGNWATILKCGFNHERTASQLSQRWALIRKRREVAEKAGYRVGPGYSASTPGSSGQAGASPFVTPAVSSPGSLEPALNGNTGSAIPGHAPSTSVPGGHVGSPAGVPISATQSPPSVAQNVQGQGTGSVAVYAMNSSAANTITNTYSKANSSRPATGLGGTSSRLGHSLSGQSAAVGTLCVNGVSSATGLPTVTGTGTGQANSTGAVVAGSATGASLHPSGAIGRNAPATHMISVGGGEMRNTSTLPLPTAVMTSATGKYVLSCNNVGASGARGRLKGPHGPDPMVQAAAVAAGARIAPASAAASLLMAAQSGNVVHIGPGGMPITKVGHSNQAGSAQHLNSVSSRGPSAIVHYIRTGAGVPPSAAPGMTMTIQRTPSQHNTKIHSSRSLGNGQAALSAPKSNSSPVPVTSAQASRNNAHVQTGANHNSKSNGPGRSGSRSHSSPPSPIVPAHENSRTQPSNDSDSPASTLVRGAAYVVSSAAIARVSSASAVTTSESAQKEVHQASATSGRGAATSISTPSPPIVLGGSNLVSLSLAEPATKNRVMSSHVESQTKKDSNPSDTASPKYHATDSDHNLDNNPQKPKAVRQ